MASDVGRAFAGTLVAGAFLVLLAGGARAQPAVTPGAAPEVRAALNAGVDAFKNARYEDAVLSFRKATQLEPGNETAHIYLATAYAYQVVPNLMTPENLQTADMALAELDIALKIHPDDMNAMKMEASLYRNIQRYDEAMSGEKRIAEVNPKDAEAFYIMGFTDWTRAYQNAQKILADDGLTDDGVGNARMTGGACRAMRAKNAALVEDGIRSLTRAIALKPDYDDAMQYLQLTYRQHANFACGDAAARGADMKLADEWTSKAMAARRQSEQRKLDEAVKQQ